MNKFSRSGQTEVGVYDNRILWGLLGWSSVSCVWWFMITGFYEDYWGEKDYLILYFLSLSSPEL